MKKKSRKQVMRDLKRSIQAKIGRTDRAYGRLVYDTGPTARKARKTVKSVPEKAENTGLEVRDPGTNPGENDRTEAKDSGY